MKRRPKRTADTGKPMSPEEFAELQRPEAERQAGIVKPKRFKTKDEKKSDPSLKRKGMDGLAGDYTQDNARRRNIVSYADAAARLEDDAYWDRKFAGVDPSVRPGMIAFLWHKAKTFR